MTDLDALKEDLAYLRERGDLAAALTATTAELHRLIEEVERLRTHRELCTGNLLKGYETGKAEERAAVVAWLRASANAEHPIERGVPALSPAGRGMLLLHADRIERGEHRREEER